METKRIDDGIIELNVRDLESHDDIAKIANAYSSKIRLKILYLLTKTPVLSVNDLLKELKISKTNLLFHLQILNDAGIISSRYKSTDKRSYKIFSRSILTTTISVRSQRPKYKEEQEYSQATESLKVGRYWNYEGIGYCFATKDKLYIDASSKYSSERFDAEILYSQNGLITYRFANNYIKSTIHEIKFDLEICSEASYYDNNYKSDITFFINEKEICTYLSPGDYGDRIGNLNPSWWPKNNTQYGNRVTVVVNEKGAFLNGILTNSKIKIDDLNLNKNNFIDFKFGNKPTSTHIGGFNVFGKCFGDYPQDINMTFLYEK